MKSNEVGIRLCHSGLFLLSFFHSFRCPSYTAPKEEKKYGIEKKAKPLEKDELNDLLFWSVFVFNLFDLFKKYLALNLPK